MNFKQKLSLVVLIVISGVLSVYGGFRVNHIDTEYHKTLYNKSYFLHNIYHVTSQIEFEVKKLLFDKRHQINRVDLQTFKKSNQRHGVSLYLVNAFFAMLGVFFCFRLAFLLMNDFWFSYLAAAILASCYFWNAEAHYPTTDVALSSLLICFLFFLSHRLINKESSNTESKVYEGLLLGACFAVKYAGMIVLIPYLYFKYKQKTLKESIPSILIAVFVLAACIADKFKDLWYYCNVEYKVQTEYGWAGYNSDESGFLYHLKNSLIAEYGLTLTLLALIGIYFAYSKLKADENKYLSLQVILLFMLSLSIMICSTIIKTVRFALPLIPFLSIFSAFGVYYIYGLIKKISPNISKITTILIILIATLPALRNSIRHDYLMAKIDTAEIVFSMRKALKKAGAVQVIMDDKQLFDKTPNLEDIEYIKRCSAPAKDFKEIFKFEQYPEIIVFTNSYKLDRFIFDKTYHCDSEHKAFRNYENLKLLQINPFKIEKDKVPFSFISNFSPRKPDLEHRNFKGAFFEIFYVDSKYEAVMRKACEENNYPCLFTNGASSYFLSKIQTSFVDPEVRAEQKRFREEGK